MKTLSLYAVSGLLVLPLASDIQAPAALNPGPKDNIRTLEYHLAAEKDPAVIGDRNTEVWAKVTYSPIARDGSSPLIVFLHGNHGTCGTGQNPRRDTSCQYTSSGSCPAGYVVTPNHLGYDYIAQHLATWGYTVVSINANLGITCGGGVPGDSGLNLARGKLVIKHLNLLSQWAGGGGNPPNGMVPIAKAIDWNQVGFVGHSRGGEGMRAALYYLNHPTTLRAVGTRVPPAKVRGVYEIGAVDGQTGLVLNAEGVVWNQMLPMCDGDVSDLEGRHPYDRMIGLRSEPITAQKSLYFVWGANHNYFNTEWQTSDSSGCRNHQPLFGPSIGSGYSSPGQQLVARNAITSFFLSIMYPDAAMRKQGLNFNPLAKIPDEVLKTTRIEREFTATPSGDNEALFEGFDKPTGTNSSGVANRAEGIAIQHQKLSRNLMGASIAWTSKVGSFFESNWTAEGSGHDVSSARALEFRASRRSADGAAVPPLNFSVELVDASGKASNQIKAVDYVSLLSPVHSEVTLQTVRVPMTAFSGVNFAAIRSVRFVFNETEAGTLALATIQFSRLLGMSLDSARLTLMRNSPMMEGRVSAARGNFMQSVTVSANENRYLGSRRASVNAQWSELWLESTRGFPVRDEMAYLSVGSKVISLSRYVDGDLHRLAFILPTPQLKDLRSGMSMTVSYGAQASSNLRYQIGTYNPALVVE